MSLSRFTAGAMTALTLAGGVPNAGAEENEQKAPTEEVRLSEHMGGDSSMHHLGIPHSELALAPTVDEVRSALCTRIPLDPDGRYQLKCAPDPAKYASLQHASLQLPPPHIDSSAVPHFIAKPKDGGKLTLVALVITVVQGAVTKITGDDPGVISTSTTITIGPELQLGGGKWSVAPEVFLGLDVPVGEAREASPKTKIFVGGGVTVGHKTTESLTFTGTAFGGYVGREQWDPAVGIEIGGEKTVLKTPYVDVALRISVAAMLEFGAGHKVVMVEPAAGFVGSFPMGGSAKKEHGDAERTPGEG